MINRLFYCIIYVVINLITETLQYVEIDQSNSNTAAIIVAGGSSQRMKGINKLLYPILDIPVIARTLMAYENCASIGGIYVACRESDIADIQNICDKYGIVKLKAIVKGGDTRAQSVKNAFDAIDPIFSYVAIADGARPLTTPEIIDRVLDEAMRCGAALCAVPVTDTVKVADGNRFIESTPDRSRLWAAQTPQIFNREIYANALSFGGDFTDDCALVEAAGTKVKIVEGSPTNIKITVPTDIIIAEALIKEAEK